MVERLHRIKIIIHLVILQLEIISRVKQVKKLVKTKYL